MSPAFGEYFPDAGKKEGVTPGIESAGRIMFETITRRTPMSRGFRCALFGLAMTVVARVGPWSWPGWPAVTVLDFALAYTAPSVAGSVYKGLGILLLIIVNAGFWAGVAYAVVFVWKRWRG